MASKKKWFFGKFREVKFKEGENCKFSTSKKNTCAACGSAGGVLSLKLPLVYRLECPK